MAILSRSGRNQKTSEQLDGHSIAHSNHPVPTHHPAHNGSRKYATKVIDSSDGQPAAKRRKLETSHKQTTLDAFAVRRPPTKVTIAEPHGQLVESLNGVQHKLDVQADHLSDTSSPTATAPNTQPALAKRTKVSEKRTLRSQDDGPRVKSELAVYFPNYEDVILDAPQQAEFVTVDSAIYITDDTHKTDGSPSKASAGPTTARKANGSTSTHAQPVTPNRSQARRLSNSPRESLRMIARTLPDNPDDPLTDEHFFKSHRRAERKEKQLRNIERERAMHEKVQLERLLDGLEGHDWLKVLGLTGITDGEAKKYEIKRDYFIGEVRALVGKFKQWKEQEKLQRIHKEELVAAAREAESEEPASSRSSVGPSSSELNASASRQLQMETANALKALPKLKLTFKGRSNNTTPSKPALLPPSPEVPITSFYEKRHLRDAALGKARHGRNATAFGHAIPDLEEKEFAIPHDLVTEEFLRANARERRRRKRESAGPNKAS